MAAKTLPACPVETTLTLISDKWKVLILRDLLPGTKRFGELKKSVGQCQSKGVDGSASSNGGQWPAHPDRLPRGAATGGVYAYRIGIQLETDFGRHVELGRGVSG